MKRETYIKILTTIVMVSLIILGTLNYDVQGPSCDSTLPGCEERFFGPRATGEDMKRVGDILNRSVGEMVEGIVNR